MSLCVSLSCICLSLFVSRCGSKCLCVSDMCTCVSPVVPPCAYMHVPARTRAHSREGGSWAYQLDDVGDAEPVGLLDVLASLHEAFIALKVSGQAVRWVPMDAENTAHPSMSMEPRPKPLLAGSRPRGPDCRGASTPRALGDEAGSVGVRGVRGQSWAWLESRVLGERPGTRRSPGEPSAGPAGWCIIERDSLSKVLLSQADPLKRVHELHLGHTPGSEPEPVSTLWPLCPARTLSPKGAHCPASQGVNYIQK